MARKEAFQMEGFFYLQIYLQITIYSFMQFGVYRSSFLVQELERSLQIPRD